MRTLPRLVLAACAFAAALLIAQNARASDRPVPGTAALEGMLAWRSVRGEVQPLGFANVLVLGPKLGTMSDDTGRFRVIGIPAGTWRVKVMQATFRPLDTLLTFSEHGTTRLDAVLVPEPLGNPGDAFRGAERPSAELRRRLARADVVRAFRLTRMPDAPTDTSNAIGGARIVAELTRDAAWQRRLRSAFGHEKSWSHVGTAGVDMSELYGLRFHDANGWVDVVVSARSSWVSVSESGERSTAYAWNVNRGPVGRWFE
ncbi:MAG: hypothetical protein IPJ04_02445 [Candidatus Eisenbacteria bacterium]|nr:hypothetical protein [Candidatus Eisenbacteria bacterium]